MTEPTAPDAAIDAAAGPATAADAERPRRGPRPQPERRAAMRARLLDATVASLVEVGWAGTSLPAITARAGVGRGAQVHHFPTRAVLIEAVGTHLLERNRQEFTVALGALPEEGRTLGAAIDVLWSILHGDTWTAIVELGLASRTDPTVQGAFEQFTAQVDDVILETVHEHFPALAANPYGTSLVRGTVALLFGLAVQTSIDRDHAGHHAEVFRDLQQLVRLVAPGLAGPDGAVTPSPDPTPRSQP